MKRFAVAAIIFVEAADKETADDLAGRHVTMENGSVLLLDEKLPTVEVPNEKEYLHSILDVPEFAKKLKID